MVFIFFYYYLKGEYIHTDGAKYVGDWFEDS
jgi:hypothetical protein